MRNKPKLFFYATIFTFSYNSSLHSQSISDTSQPKTYLLNYFMNGKVMEKNGVVHEALLNYNTENQSVMFKDGQQNMVLTGLDNIDTIFLAGKKFIPSEEKFYEVATNTEITLLVGYTYKTTPLSAQVDHEGTSLQQSQRVSNNVSEAYMNKRFQGKYAIEFLPHFWLKRGRSLYKAGNEKQVAKIFPAKEKEIHQFVQDNKTDFSRETDMAALVNYCSK